MNRSRIQLQLVESSDASAIETMAREIWPHAYGGIISKAQIDFMLDWMYSCEKIEAEIENQRIRYFWIATDSSNQGFLSVGPGDSKGVFPLHKLYLKSRSQRQGYGKEALAILVEILRSEKASALELRVNRHNRRAISFYQKQGFSKIRDDVAEIGGGFRMDDFVMQLDLSG